MVTIFILDGTTPETRSNSCFKYFSFAYLHIHNIGLITNDINGFNFCNLLLLMQMEVKNLKLLVKELKGKIEKLEEENGKLKEKLKKGKGNKAQQLKRWREKNREKYLEQKKREHQKRRQRRRDNEECVEEVRVKTEPSD